MVMVNYVIFSLFRKDQNFLCKDYEDNAQCQYNGFYSTNKSKYFNHVVQYTMT